MEFITQRDQGNKTTAYTNSKYIQKVSPVESRIRESGDRKVQVSTLNSAIRISFTEKKTGEQNLEEDTTWRAQFSRSAPSGTEAVGLRHHTTLPLRSVLRQQEDGGNGSQSRNRHRLYWPSLAFDHALLSRPIYPRQRINKLQSLDKLLSRLQKVRAKPFSRSFIFQIMNEVFVPDSLSQMHSSAL